MKKFSASMATILAGILMLGSLSACGTAKTDTAATATSPETEAVAENTADTEAATEQTSGESGQIEGIVWEASNASIQIQVEDGTQYFLTKADDCTTDLADGLLLGEAVKVDYTGNLDDGSAEAVAIADSDLELACPREAYEFAISIIEDIKLMDQENFANFLSYPCYMNMDADGNGQQFDAREDFMAVDKETVFTEDFCMLADANLFEMVDSEAGYVMYLDDSHAGFTFKQNEEAYLIVGFSIYK